MGAALSYTAQQGIALTDNFSSERGYKHTDTFLLFNLQSDTELLLPWRLSENINR